MGALFSDILFLSAFTPLCDSKNIISMVIIINFDFGISFYWQFVLKYKICNIILWCNAHPFWDLQRIEKGWYGVRFKLYTDANSLVSEQWGQLVFVQENGEHYCISVFLA